MIKLKCPECNASLEFEEGRNFAFCSYCGTKLLLTENNDVNLINQEEEHLVKSAIQQLKIGNMEKASDLFYRLREKYPSNIVGYLGGAKLILENNSCYKFRVDPLYDWTDIESDRIKIVSWGVTYIAWCYHTAYKLSNNEIAYKIKEEYENIIDYIKTNFYAWETTIAYQEIEPKIVSLSEKIELNSKEVYAEQYNKWRWTDKKLNELKRIQEQLKKELNDLRNELNNEKAAWVKQVESKSLHIPDILGGNWGMGIDC